MRVRLTSLNDFAEWRQAARALLLQGIHPEDVAWDDPAARPDLFAEPEERPPGVANRAVGVVPPRFIELAEAALCHREPIRFGLLYRLLFRLQKNRALLEARSDPDISKLYRLATEVRRDSQQMKQLAPLGETEAGFAAWYEPGHYTLERTVPFFARRFGQRQWAILTPYRSAAHDGETLIFGAGTSRQDAPRRDAPEAEWRSYFAGIFRPAPAIASGGRNSEAGGLISSLSRSMRQAEDKMVRATPKVTVEPDEAAAITSLADARAAVQGCRRCPLYEHATQAVFGEGPAHAEVMFVGEQPGDQEDLAGRPFVGPAGQVFNAALDKVGIDRARVYVTNAVKHFKIRAARQEAHSFQAQWRRDHGLPLLDRSRARIRPAQADRGAGRDGGAEPAGQGRLDRLAARQEDRAARWRHIAGDGASVLSAAAAGPGQGGRGVAAFRGGSAGRQGVHRPAGRRRAPWRADGCLTLGGAKPKKARFWQPFRHGAG